MKHKHSYMICLIVAIIIFQPTTIPAANRNPIILIHGFIGWGREEMKGYHYWGGEYDLQQILRDAGYDVHSVSVGPVSSNWDRAIEAFYQIKGGTVDYGKSHSEKYGLIRSPAGKSYEGIYPQWDSEHPVHIISHSMGGQTATMLEYLLKTTFQDEDSMLLSESCSGWIKSITSISAPHNGTTLTPIVVDLFPFIQKMAVFLGGWQEDSFVEKYYDFDLEQWGLARRDGESRRNYLSRIKASKLSETKNFCTWDLSLEGASEFNRLYEPDPSTYYFSFATYATRKKSDSDFQIPDEKMNWRLWTTGYMIGRFQDAGKSWYENDGVVNTVSMWGPKNPDTATDYIADFTGIPVPGVWQKMKRLHFDHEEVIGHKLGKFDAEDMISLFTEQCELLYTLD